MEVIDGFNRKQLHSTLIDMPVTNHAIILLQARYGRHQIDETGYFISNRVPGRDGWSLRAILRVAFSRAQVEGCFRESKEELGMDHFECRGWRCIHRHLYVTILSGLFCARVRQQLSPSELVTSGELLTMEQVRRAANVFIETMAMPPKQRS